MAFHKRQQIRKLFPQHNRQTKNSFTKHDQTAENTRPPKTQQGAKHNKSENTYLNVKE